MHVTPHPFLNTPTAHNWAAVVSGTVWEGHAFGPGATLESKWARGPLIVWATKTAPRLAAFGYMAPAKVQGDAPAPAASFFAGLNCWRRILQVITSPRRRKKTRRLMRLVHTSQKAQEARDCFAMIRFPHLSGVAAPPAPLASDPVEEVMVLVRDLLAMTGDPKQRTEVLEHLEQYPGRVAPLLGMLQVLKVSKTRGNLIDLCRQALTRGAAVAAFLLRRLEAEAFRAHITRRVKPARPSARIPRPIHARPRPPTAPTAPPVT